MSNTRPTRPRPNDRSYRERNFYSGTHELNKIWEWLALAAAVATIIAITFAIGQPPGQTGMATTFENTPLAVHGSPPR